jgi:predicted ester cyclase
MDRKGLKRVDDDGIAAWDERDPKRFVGLLANDFIWFDTMAGQMASPEEAVAYMESWFEAFPNMRVTRTHRVVDEVTGQVAGEVEFTGTNTGRLVMGGKEMPATGREVAGRGTYLARVNDGGLIVEFRSNPDGFGMAAQLGLFDAA